MSRYFSLITWGPVSDFPLIRLEFDWCRATVADFGWFGATVSLLGFSANLTYWPTGKVS